jgi:hypothetical protein
MSDWRHQCNLAIEDFRKVCELALVDLSRNCPSVEFLAAPHRPPSRLPMGKIAVYAFHWDDTWLKAGVAGPKSNARYTNQHYRANPKEFQDRLSLKRGLVLA